MRWQRILHHFTQMIQTIFFHKDGVEFLYNHKLWSGFWKYSWVAKSLVFLAMLVGWKTIMVIIDLGESYFSADSVSVSSVFSFGESFLSEEYNLLFTGSMKYIMIILLEVVIFHISRKTLETIGVNGGESSFNAFIQAQVRMLKIAVRSWILESIMVVIVKMIFNFFGFLDFLQPAFIFGIQCFFVGLAVVDNYFEQFEIRMEDSIRLARKFAGVCLGVGLVFQLLMVIPILGPILGPALAAVTATLLLYKLLPLSNDKEVEADVLLEQIA